MFRSLIHNKLISVYDVRKGGGMNFFVSIWIVSCPSIICSEDCPFLIEFTWHLYRKSVFYINMGLHGPSILFHQSIRLS